MIVVIFYPWKSSAFDVFSTESSSFMPRFLLAEDAEAGCFSWIVARGTWIWENFTVLFSKLKDSIVNEDRKFV